MDLTIDKAIAYHRQLWDWLSENPEKEKEDWPGWNDFYEKYPDYKWRSTFCFACFMDKDCEECVLEWPGMDCTDMNNLGDLKGLAQCWQNAKDDKDTRVSLARQIRDLPVRYPAETWNPLEAWRDA